ncbi:MAG: hypothetical protein CVU09_05245 [Bacteroidetes bacterium HGW-Bacteroidetes-4]|jgi:hypothetical protein|nr:MAG: hypothetical protein CVU09_05245 [Bacteroidetes bacterium HGW-Bacteroidetes-4]
MKKLVLQHTNNLLKLLIVTAAHCSFLFLYQCQAPYENEYLAADKQIPVVNGIFSSLNSIQSFELYYARPYSSRGTRKISGAQVTLIEDNNLQISLNEVSDGNYQLTETFIPQSGKIYHIEVLLPNGTLLASEKTLMPDTIGINSIFYDFNNHITLVKDQQGNYSEVVQQGIFVNLRLNKPLQPKAYYRTKGDYYVHSQKWKNTSRMFTVEGPVYDYNYQIRYDTLFDIIEGFSNTEFPIIGSLDASINYSPADLTLSTIFLPADQECVNFSLYTSNTFVQWIFPVDLITTSKTSFDYYTNALEQWEAAQRIYDPIPEQLTGNMFSPEQPEQAVLGLFDVVSVSRRYYAVYVHESFGYRSYQGRFFQDTVFHGGSYVNQYRVDTIFIDSTLHNAGKIDSTYF